MSYVYKEFESSFFQKIRTFGDAKDLRFFNPELFDKNYYYNMDRDKYEKFKNFFYDKFDLYRTEEKYR